MRRAASRSTSMNALFSAASLLGADGEAIGVDELRLDTDEVEHP